MAQGSSNWRRTFMDDGGSWRTNQTDRTHCAANASPLCTGSRVGQTDPTYAQAHIRKEFGNERRWIGGGCDITGARQPEYHPDLHHAQRARSGRVRLEIGSILGDDNEPKRECRRVPVGDMSKGRWDGVYLQKL